MIEYEYEPIPGLPGELPEGEQVLWQGTPSWESLAKRVFQVYTLSLYFILLIVAHLIFRVMDGAPASMISGTLVARWFGGIGDRFAGVVSALIREGNALHPHQSQTGYSIRCCTSDDH